MDILETTPVVASDSGNQPGGQPTVPQDGATPETPATPSADLTVEQLQTQMATLQQKLDRANGQISATQKKYQSLVRGRMTPPSNPANPTADGQDDPTQVVFTAMNMAGAELRNQLEVEIFPLYDGSDPNMQEPALPANEISKIRKNPWAFVSQEALRYALQTGDLQPAKLEIEQEMADRAEALENGTAKPAPKIPKNINSNPAPAGAQPAKAQEADPWNMSMQDLEQKVKSSASKAAV